MATTVADVQERRAEEEEARPNLSRDLFDDRDPGTAALHELIFGRPGSVDVAQESTLTPEQQALLQQLLAQGPQAADQVTGGQIDTSQLSLEDLAALRSEIASGQAAQTFGAVAERAQDPEARQAAFEAQSQPLIEEAQRATATVGREFGSSGFFGSERQQADADVVQAFARAETELMANLIREDEDRAIAAATGLTQVSQLEAQLATTQLNVELQAAIASGNNELAAQIQNSINQLAAQQNYQSLLGVQGVENIVLNEGGTSGQAGSAVGGIAGAIFSDRRLKKDIKHLIMLPIGIPLVSWKWRFSGRWSFGVIAQDVLRVLPEAVSKVHGILRVNYAMVAQAVSRIRTEGDK